MLHFRNCLLRRRSLVMAGDEYGKIYLSRVSMAGANVKHFNGFEFSGRTGGDSSAYLVCVPDKLILMPVQEGYLLNAGRVRP